MTRTNGQTNKSSMTMRVLLLLTTTSSPIITTTNVVSAWSGLPSPMMSSRLTASSSTNGAHPSTWIQTIRHATPTANNSRGGMKLHMANNPEEEERRPIAREGEWSAYMDENYNRIYYFNHESVS
eukprot:scaffold3950_cov100-Skeletonema_dohrnii-CCMP3373.AAC.4